MDFTLLFKLSVSLDNQFTFDSLLNKAFNRFVFYIMM